MECFKAWFCVYGWAEGIGLCVLTVWASGDRASIGVQRLFKTWRLLEHRHQNPRHLLEASDHITRTSYIHFNASIMHVCVLSYNEMN